VNLPPSPINLHSSETASANDEGSVLLGNPKSIASPYKKALAATLDMISNSFRGSEFLAPKYERHRQKM
jgi:hypothetical protein